MSQQVEDFNTPVAIVGAGPVGLALAIDLAHRGIPFIQIDRADSALDFPTSEAIFVRTMEHFRRWGMADAIRFAGFPPDLKRNVYFMTRILGHELLRMDRPSNREQQQSMRELSPEGALWCPKKLFEPLMRQRVQAAPKGQLWTGWELTGFSQDEAGASLELQHTKTGAKRRLRCQYLAACDGASSGIRKALGIEMQGTFAEGHNFGIYFRSAQLREIMRDRPGVMVDIMNPEAFANLSTVDGNDLWRLIRMMGPADASRLTPQDCLRSALGQTPDGKDVAVEIIDARPWAGHTVVADDFRAGRVFLVGDAAHLLWPRGGFGMNTGIGDAVDLAWKLQAMLEGWGGPKLLDSYTPERKPIAARNVAEAASNYKAQMALKVDPALDKDGPAGEAARGALAEIIREKRAKEWNTVGVQLGYVYEGSPVIASEPPVHDPRPFDPGRYEPTTRPGARAPHGWLADGASLLDHYGAGFVLVHAPDADPGSLLAAASAVAGAAGMPLRALALQDAGLRKLYEAPLVLVRPDGHVAWRGNALPKDAREVLDHARGA